MGMDTWRHGDIETWRLEMETWKHEEMETLRHGNIETWRHGDIEQKMENEKRKPVQFSLIRLPCCHRANRSLLLVRLLTKTQMEVIHFQQTKTTKQTKQTPPSMQPYTCQRSRLMSMSMSVSRVSVPSCFCVPGPCYYPSLCLCAHPNPRPYPRSLLNVLAVIKK
jgi:hypothetical protein